MGPTSTSTTVKDIRSVPYQKLRFVPTFSGGGIVSWPVQTEDGTRYTFAAIETNTDANSTSPGGAIPTHSGDVYNSAWQLTQIKTPGGDVITLTYTAYTANYKIGGYTEKFDQVVSNPPAPACVSPQFDVFTGYQVVTQRLTTITSAAHTVTFVPGNTLRTDALSPTATQSARASR
jgi:hypothetical protein